MCITNSLCCTAEIKHNIVNQLYFNLKKNRKKKEARQEDFPEMVEKAHYVWNHEYWKRQRAI